MNNYIKVIKDYMAKNECENIDVDKLNIHQIMVLAMLIKNKSDMIVWDIDDPSSEAYDYFIQIKTKINMYDFIDFVMAHNISNFNNEGSYTSYAEYIECIKGYISEYDEIIALLEAEMPL